MNERISKIIDDLELVEQVAKEEVLQLQREIQSGKCSRSEVYKKQLDIEYLNGVKMGYSFSIFRIREDFPKDEK